MKIRPYVANDKDAVLKLLELNTPKFFDINEREDLKKYLTEEIEDYFIVEEKGKIVNAGVINYFPDEKTARISWDIIKPESQGKGIGKQLINHRIDLLNKNNEVNLIIVRTTQLVYKFYESIGFTLTKVEKNFWADGFDLYQLEQKNKFMMPLKPNKH